MIEISKSYGTTNKQTKKRNKYKQNNTMNKKRKIIKSGETKPRKKEKLSYQSVDGKSGCIDCPVCLEVTEDNIIVKYIRNIQYKHQTRFYSCCNIVHFDQQSQC